MPNAFNWTCPYCGSFTTITEQNHSTKATTQIDQNSKMGSVAVSATATSCPNPDCRELTLSVALHEYGLSHGNHGSWVLKGAPLRRWSLLPRSRAKPQPAYIPEAIRKDYEEACLILNDSPKASATMSRRCLQGIVRDFWHLPENKRGNLGAELSAIRDKVVASTWDAITTIREVGDIGAHMDKDVNYVVDVEPEEAALLIELVELLFQDWYIDRYNRVTRDAAVKALVGKKRAEKKEVKALSRQAGVPNESPSEDLEPE